MKEIRKLKFLGALCLFSINIMLGQQREASVEGNVNNWPVHEYSITIDEEKVNKTGDAVMAMTINGQIPGPVLEFTEGEYAKIHVTNNMDVETSVHWHGLLLPNFYDGVPYLSTPPILPGETLTYEFSLKQSGTYWYHSHTGLQEQRGVYGAIQINPRENEADFEYDHDLVLTLSDWMDEKPHKQLKNLKRGNEWYLIKKGQIQSLNKILKKNALGAKLKMSWQRMPDMAISDNYHDLFLVNGKPKQEYPQFKPGEKIRLRFVNASAASYFWLTFGGEEPTLISADGLNVVPIKKNKTLIAVAETYDFLVTIPENGKLQIRATSQDGSGESLTYLGEGPVIPAPEVPEPDLIEMMKQMMSMDMKMGAPATKFRPSREDSIKVMKKYAMEMEGMEMNHSQMDMNEGEMEMDHGEMKDHQHEEMKMKRDSSEMKMEGHQEHMENRGEEPLPAEVVIGSNMKTAGNPTFNYDYLKSPEKTTIPDEQPLKEMLFNLTGNMNRYVWSINGVPLAETDKIKIKQGQKVRITLNNLTMMHHPMHLHGHFFRVINEHGEYSPLKHTVNVAPMQKTVIEFDANEYGDWFFHCHVLYHINSGMARVISYDTPRDERLEEFPLQNLTTEANEIFTWGEVMAGSHMTELYATATNLRNQLTVRGEYGWNENLEASLTYERYLNDFFRLFGGVNVENEGEDSLDELETTAIGGIRYLLPLLINSELQIDNKLRPQIGLSAGLMVFPRIGIYGEFEYQMDFGWVNDLPGGSNFENETTWQVGSEFVISKTVQLFASYDNRFGAGGGLSVWF